MWVLQTFRPYDICKTIAHQDEILATGYGLSFWPIPVMASIGGFIGNEFGELDKYVWFIPVRSLSDTFSVKIVTDNFDRLGQSP